jgi:sec-independent protein translocase protein TatA
MFGLSLGHLIILLVVVLLFGSRKLPELGSALGRGVKAFKDGLEGHETKHSQLIDKDSKDTPPRTS